MRPTFLGFEASKSALYASQKALDITGNNLANASSQGYTRQRVDQVSVNYNMYSTRGYINSRIGTAGQGVNVLGIGQTRDKQLDNAFRIQCSEIGGYDQKSAILSDIEEALQEFDIGETGNGYGLRNALSNLYNALQDFSTDAGSATYASVAADSFKQIALALREKYDSLEQVGEKYKDNLESDIDSANVLLQKIAYLNGQIKDAMVSNDYTSEYGPNELLDERNLLIDKLSSYGEVSVKNNADGTVDVFVGDRQAIDGRNYDELEYAENTDGTVRVQWKSTGEYAATGQGVIDSAYVLLNGRGVNMKNPTETSEKGIPYYKDKLNAFAVQLAAAANNTIPDEVDQAGNVISYKKLFGAESDDGEVYPDMHVTAENIWISDDLESSINYLLNDNGNDTDNSALLTLIGKLSNQKIDFDGFNGTFEEFITDYVTGLGNDLSYINENYDNAVKVGNTIDQMRDSVMGVSETEETTSMLMYNRAFQAASRMMTVMDDLLDVIINQMAV